MEVSAKDGTNIDYIFEMVASNLIPGMSPDCADMTYDQIPVEDLGNGEEAMEEDFQKGVPENEEQVSTQGRQETD